MDSGVVASEVQRHGLYTFVHSSDIVWGLDSTAALDFQTRHVAVGSFLVEFAKGSCMAAFGAVEGFEFAAAIDSNPVSGVAASGARHQTEDTSVPVADSLVFDATAADEFQTPGLAVGSTEAVGFEAPASGGFEAALVALAYAAPCKAVGFQELVEILAAFVLWKLDLQQALRVASLSMKFASAFHPFVDVFVPQARGFPGLRGFFGHQGTPLVGHHHDVCVFPCHFCPDVLPVSLPISIPGLCPHFHQDVRVVDVPANKQLIP